MRLKIVFFISLCLLISCTSNTNKNLPEFEGVDGKTLTKNIKTAKTIHDEIKHVKVKTNYDEFLYLNNVFDSIWGIRLETNDSSIIGNIDKIKIIDNDIYLLDKYHSKSLKRFNNKGLFKAAYGRIGKGPGEYYEPTDFYILQNSVVIYDQFSAKLNHYDLEGNYRKSERVPFILNALLYSNKDEIICHTFSTDNYHVEKIKKYSLLWCERGFNIRYRGAYRGNDLVTNFLSRNNLDQFNDKIIYHEPYSDSIFSIYTKGIIKPVYVIDFKKNLIIPKDIFKNNNRKKLIKTFNEEYAVFFGGQIVTEDFLYFPYSIKGSVYHVFYSNNTKKVVSGNRIINDINYIYDFSNAIQCNENTLIGYMNASIVVENMLRINNDKIFNKIEEELKLDISKLTSSDNPVLVFYRLKNF